MAVFWRRQPKLFVFCGGFAQKYACAPGGWLARRRVIRGWTLAQELEWWISLIMGRKN